MEKEQREKENREKLVKAAAEKKKAVAAKEITARAPAPAKKVGPSSIQSFKSTSSVKSSISSIQVVGISVVILFQGIRLEPNILIDYSFRKHLFRKYKERQASLASRSLI